MADIFGLKGLLTTELRILYNAEKRLLEVLPEMKDRAIFSKFRDLLQRSFDDTKQRIVSLENIFHLLHQDPNGEQSLAIEGLVGEGTDLLDRVGELIVIDVVLAQSLQNDYRYLLTMYNNAYEHAKLLDFYKEIASLEELVGQVDLLEEELATLLKENLMKKAKRVPA